jgi:hypothetical protein
MKKRKIFYYSFLILACIAAVAGYLFMSFNTILAHQYSMKTSFGNLEAQAHDNDWVVCFDNMPECGFSITSQPIELKNESKNETYANLISPTTKITEPVCEALTPECGWNSEPMTEPVPEPNWPVCDALTPECGWHPEPIIEPINPGQPVDLPTPYIPEPEEPVVIDPVIVEPIPTDPVP